MPVPRDSGEWCGILAFALVADDVDQITPLRAGDNACDGMVSDGNGDIECHAECVSSGDRVIDRNRFPSTVFGSGAPRCSGTVGRFITSRVQDI